MEKLDYSSYQIEAKKGLRNCEELILKREFEQAHDKLSEVIAELRLMRAALNDHIK